MIRAGEIPPPFTLTALDGTPRSLTSLLGGQGVALCFFKISCPTCQFALPYLGRAAASGARIVAVSQDNPELTQLFEQKFHSSLDYLLDRAQDGYPVSNAFGIEYVPTTFVLSPQGRVLEVIHGFDKEAFESLGVVFTEADRVPLHKPG